MDVSYTDHSHIIVTLELVVVSSTSVIIVLALLTPSSHPPTLMWGSFLLLAPTFSLEGQMTQVFVSAPILSKNSAATSPNSGEFIIINSSFLLSTRNLCSYSNCCSHSELMSSLEDSLESPEAQSSPLANLSCICMRKKSGWRWRGVLSCQPVQLLPT